MKQVYSAQHPTEAHYIKGLLESQGIPCLVKGEALFGVRGELPLTVETAPSVWVTDISTFTQARELIEEYEKQHNQPSSSKNNWVCTSC